MCGDGTGNIPAFFYCRREANPKAQNTQYYKYRPIAALRKKQIDCNANDTGGSSNKYQQFKKIYPALKSVFDEQNSPLPRTETLQFSQYFILHLLPVINWIGGNFNLYAQICQNTEKSALYIAADKGRGKADTERVPERADTSL